MNAPIHNAKVGDHSEIIFPETGRVIPVTVIAVDGSTVTVRDDVGWVYEIGIQRKH